MHVASRASMDNSYAGRTWLTRSLVPIAGFFAIPLFAGCGSNSDSDDGNDGAAGADSSSGGSGGTSGSGNAGDAGESGDDFACESDAAPGPLVEVPAGSFIMGCNDSVDAECLDDELPMHVVTLSAFEIERTEVTQAAYAACVTAGICDPPSCRWACEEEDLPATCIDFDQANTYCEWANRRLPTEAEWEKAARGSDGLKYPWGNAEPDCTLVNMVGCGNSATPAGSLPDGASPYGVLDMAGNMVEMVKDWYEEGYYAESPATDPTGPSSGTRYGGRGGGFKSEPTWQRASKRDWYDPTDAGASLGFRCAR
jgi:formylglycine-generating enzyme required for sulfatase activity